MAKKDTSAFTFALAMNIFERETRTMVSVIIFTIAHRFSHETSILRGSEGNEAADEGGVEVDVEEGVEGDVEGFCAAVDEGFAGSAVKKTAWR